MLVHRGTASDYEKWEQAGAEGWGPEEVLKYFKKAEVCMCTYEDGGLYCIAGDVMHQAHQPTHS
jgi:choline dehydrogenase-like flavoprotein